MDFTKKSFLSIIVCTFSFVFVIQCKQPKIIHDLSDASYILVNQDSVQINFPKAFEGKYVIAAFIYTHCPDVCRIITANLKRISTKLKDSQNVAFVEITFDPKRDTPSVLKNYMRLYSLEKGKFTMLTGQPALVDSLLNRFGIKAAVSYTDTTKSGKLKYYYNHTDRIIIMDKKGRVRFQYPGSLVPPENVIEDLNKLR